MCSSDLDMNAQELLDRLMELSKSGVNLTSLKVVVPCNDFHPTAADAIDGEFILPRGTTVEVLSDPQNLVGSDALSASINLEVIYIDCKVKT